MIVWAGGGNTGGRYAVAGDTWTPTSIGANVPTPRYQHSAVWTGREMIVWGGSPSLASGGSYCACPAGLILYRDADGDGFGDARRSRPSCDGSIPTGFVADDTDCDDGNASIHPGAAESCNAIDDDCDGTVDNGAGASCDDGDACTTDSCGATGCIHTFCDDANACTADLCDLALGCVASIANLDTTDFSAHRVDGRDLVVLADAWNSCPGDASYNPVANLDRGIGSPDACIGDTDFHLFMTTFGRGCP
jgi:hypothetical protein